MFAGSQVEAMRAAGPTRTEWNPGATHVVELVHELARRPQLAHVRIEKGPFVLELNGSAADGR